MKVTPVSTQLAIILRLDSISVSDDTSKLRKVPIPMIGTRAPPRLRYSNILTPKLDQKLNADNCDATIIMAWFKENTWIC